MQTNSFCDPVYSASIWYSHFIVLKKLRNQQHALKTFETLGGSPGDFSCHVKYTPFSFSMPNEKGDRSHQSLSGENLSFVIVGLLNIFVHDIVILQLSIWSKLFPTHYTKKQTQYKY